MKNTKKDILLKEILEIKGMMGIVISEQSTPSPTAVPIVKTQKTPSDRLGPQGDFQANRNFDPANKKSTGPITYFNFANMAKIPYVQSKTTLYYLKEPIDLSFLLNLLDGTLESSGRIIAISSNFPERIDRALIRPGRIDMIIHFKKCNKEILQEMVESFYDKKSIGLQCEDYKWSPAEVNQILFRNFEKPENAVRELNELQPKDLYGFDLVENVPLSYEEFAKE
jgi:hypothetical protein